MAKKKTPEIEVPQPEEMTGPQLVIQFQDETLATMLMQSDDNFPPFIVCVFNAEGSAQFRMQYANCTAEMRSAMLKRLEIMTEMDITAAVINERQRSQSGRILTARPGFTPKDFKNLGGDGRPQ